MHIGLIDLADPLWTGGQTFTRLLTTVLSQADGTRLTLLSSRDQKREVASINLESLRRTPGRVEGTLRSIFKQGLPGPMETAIRQENLEVVLPALDLKNHLPCGVVGWIPDFQYHHSEGFFTPQEISQRHAQASRIARFSDVVLFSSHDAQQTFAKLFPEFAAKGQVLPFPSALALSTIPPVEDVRTAFHLPEKFLFVPNQFWRHKNHHVVLDALARLKRAGASVHCVFSGLPHDSRDPENSYLSEVLQAVSRLDLRDCVSIVGFVSRGELISLLRTATLIVQPSFFEGWSTSVQDAKALGRPLVCSDIPVHREQAPAALGFFAPQDATRLAELIAEHFANLKPGPDQATEDTTLQKEKAAATRGSTSMSQ